MKKSMLILSLTLTLSYCVGQSEVVQIAPALPDEMVLPIILSGVNKAKSLRAAWQFIQDIALTSSQYAAVTRDQNIIDALANSVKNKKEAQELLFNFVNQKEIGANTAYMIIAALLKAGANVNQVDERGYYTPLVNAAEKGNRWVVKKLLNAGADVNKADQWGSTPLDWAATRGHLEVVKELLQAGADVNQANEDGVTPLIWSAGQGHLEVVKELLQAGAHVNQADSKGNAALGQGASRGHIKVVKELLQRRADPNQANSEGNTPLLLRVRRGSLKGGLEVVKELLQAGADVNQADDNGFTSLMRAAQIGDSIMIKELLNKGALINKKNKYGKTALDLTEKASVRQILQEAMVFELINEVAKDPLKINELKELMQKVTMNITDADGDTPLHKAVKIGNTELVGLILRAQPLLAGKKNNAGFTPIEWAIAHNQWVILDLFTKLTEPSEESLLSSVWNRLKGLRLG